MATFRLGPIGFPYSSTPGAVPEPELINVAGGAAEKWHAYVRSLGSQAATIS